MKKKIKPLGPYSQYIYRNHTLYSSGQIAICPETNNLIDTNIYDETHQIMKKKIKPLGPYSQYIFDNHILYSSGQIAICPETNDLINTNISRETHQIMKNIKEILIRENLDFESIVKTTIFLIDMSYYDIVNEVYKSYFKKRFPARETVEVKGLPANANIEISFIAHK